MAGATYLCGPRPGGACPSCGKETERDYTGARVCYAPDGGCGWSDWYPDCPTTPHTAADCPTNGEHDPERPETTAPTEEEQHGQHV